MFAHPLFGLAAFLMGACIGSFLNVVIYRVPLGLSVNEPKRSFCPTCKKPIPWYLNIPLVSWLCLRGKCAECHTRISMRYWWVELLTAVLFTAIWYEFPTLAAPFLMAWVALAIAIAFIDAETLSIFPVQTGLGTVCAVGAVLCEPSLIGQETWDQALWKSLLGIAAGAGLIFVIIELGKLVFGKREYKFDTPSEWSLRDARDDQDEVTLLLGKEEIGWSFLFSRKSDKVILEQGTLCVDHGEKHEGQITLTCTEVECDGHRYELKHVRHVEGSTIHAIIPREAMGRGDIYVMAMICALTGWQGIPVILLFASLAGILAAIPARMGFGSRLPFGPLLLAGGLFWLFYGYSLWDSYLTLL